MFSNSLQVSFQKLDAQSCLTLADYFEAQAAALRRRARDFEAKENGQRNSLKNLHIAGLDALEFYRRGINKNSACSKSATQNGVPFINVAAVFKSLLEQEQEEQRQAAKQRIKILRKKGQTVRQIAAAVDLSPSRVSQILKM